MTRDPNQKKKARKKAEMQAKKDSSNAQEMGRAAAQRSMKREAVKPMPKPKAKVKGPGKMPDGYNMKRPAEKLGYIHSMETMAETVHAVLSELKVEKASIIGHSMGGYVALAFAEKFPQQLEKLVLLNSSTVADSEERKENRDRAKRLVKQNKQAFISMAIKNLFTDENRNALRTEINALVEEAVQLPEEYIIASVEGLKNRKDRTEILQQYSGEKIIIAGKNDPVVPFKEIEAIAEKTNSTFISFEDGHMSYLENEEELLKVLNELF